MFLKYIQKTAYFLLIAVFFISLDRFLKILAINGSFSSPINIISDILTLSFVKNYNIAFSLPINGLFLIVLILLIIFGLIYNLIYLIKKADNKSALFLTIILFGAISNLIDRLKYGYVIDYLDLQYFTVFNIADAMIVSGVALLFFKIYKNKND